MWLYNTFPTHRFLSQTIPIKASCISHYAAFEFQFILQNAPKCDITRWNTAVYRWWNVISMHTFWNVNCLHNKTLGLINYVYVTQKRSVTNVSFSKLKNLIKACDAAHIKEDVPYVYTAFVDLMLLDPTFTWYQ